MFVSSDFSIISLLFQCRAPIIYLRIVYFYSKIKPMIYFVFGKINFEMYFFRRSSKFLFFKSLNFFLENLRNFYNSYSTYLVHGEMLLESILSCLLQNGRTKRHVKSLYCCKQHKKVYSEGLAMRNRINPLIYGPEFGLQIRICICFYQGCQSAKKSADS